MDPLYQEEINKIVDRYKNRTKKQITYLAVSYDNTETLFYELTIFLSKNPEIIFEGFYNVKDNDNNFKCLKLSGDKTLIYTYLNPVVANMGHKRIIKVLKRKPETITKDKEYTALFNDFLDVNKLNSDDADIIYRIRTMKFLKNCKLI